MSTGRLGAGDNAIQSTLIDAKGDLVTATAADTPARLAVGSNGQYLKADSTAATGLSWATLPASGKVLQVIQDTQENSTTTSSTSYVDSNLSVTITPSSTTSSILVLAQFQGYITNAGSNTNNYSTAALVRGSTQLQQATFGTYSMATSTNPEFEYTASFAHLDSPATTSATTYKVQYRAVSGQSSAMNIYGSSTIKNSIIVLEIGA